jgi:hypothetical protein
MNHNQATKRTGKGLQKASLVLGALALIGMGGMTVACSPQHEKPAETSVTQPSVSPTEKALRTNVTRAPSAAVPGTAGGGNAAVPCGFGPAGGAPCGNNG